MACALRIKVGHYFQKTKRVFYACFVFFLWDRKEGLEPGRVCERRKQFGELFPEQSARDDTARNAWGGPSESCAGHTVCPSAPAKNASTAFAVGAFFVCDNCNLNPKARAACRATPPKRRLRRSKRGGVGAAVNFARRSKAPAKLGTARGVAKQLQVLLPLPKMHLPLLRWVHFLYVITAI